MTDPKDIPPPSPPPGYHWVSMDEELTSNDLRLTHNGWCPVNIVTGEGSSPVGNYMYIRRVDARTKIVLVGWEYAQQLPDATIKDGYEAAIELLREKGVLT